MSKKQYTSDDDMKLIKDYAEAIMPFIMTKISDLSRKAEAPAVLENFIDDSDRLIELAYMGMVVDDINEIVKQLDPESCIKTIKKLRKFYIEHHGCIGKTKDKDCYEMISLLQSLAEFEKRKGMTDDD